MVSLCTVSREIARSSSRSLRSHAGHRGLSWNLKRISFTWHRDGLADSFCRFPKLLKDSGCPKFYNAGNVAYNDRGKHCKLEGERW